MSTGTVERAPALPSPGLIVLRLCPLLCWPCGSFAALSPGLHDFPAPSSSSPGPSPPPLTLLDPLLFLGRGGEAPILFSWARVIHIKEL